MSTNTAYQPATYNTGVVRGDTFSEEFSFATGGVPLDLTGAAIRIQLRTRSDDTVGVYSVGDGLTCNGSSMVWRIESGVTGGLVPGQYRYDIEITLGSTVRTYLAGVFAVQKDITL